MRADKTPLFQIYLQNTHFLLAGEILTLVREKIPMFREEGWSQGACVIFPIKVYY